MCLSEKREKCTDISSAQITGMGTHSYRLSCFSHEAIIETMETTRYKLQKTPLWYATGRVRRECQAVREQQAHSHS